MGCEYLTLIIPPPLLFVPLAPFCPLPSQNRLEFILKLRKFPKNRDLGIILSVSATKTV